MHACVIYCSTGLCNCGINVHLLRHLVYYVKVFGPLWTHSAFSFEGQMFNFLQKSHASHAIEKQVHTIKCAMQ